MKAKITNYLGKTSAAFFLFFVGVCFVANATVTPENKKLVENSSVTLELLSDNENGENDDDGHVPGENLLANGDFSDGEAGWSGNALNVVTENGNSYNAANVAAAGNPWDVNLSYVLNIPEEGVAYVLTFDAWSDTTRPITAGIGLNQDPWTNVNEDVTLTTDIQTFELEFTSNFASSTSRVIFDMGQATGAVNIDNVSLVIVESDDDGDDEDDEGGNNGEIGEESVEVDANATWLGFANVFELPENGGEFVFNSEWGIADIRTDLDTDNNTLTLFPNFNTYADNLDEEFWVNQTTLEGNKIFEGISFVESTELAGNVLTFSGNVESFTLSSDYEATAFIRVFNADFSFNKSVIVELTETGNFELTYDDVDLENDVTVQYGFTVTGRNANPEDMEDLGNVVVGAPSFSSQGFDELELSLYPNPVRNVLNIESANQFVGVEVYAMNGRLMTKQKNANSINMQGFASGVYLVRLTAENGSIVTKKVVKQ